MKTTYVVAFVLASVCSLVMAGPAAGMAASGVHARRELSERNLHSSRPLQARQADVYNDRFGRRGYTGSSSFTARSFKDKRSSGEEKGLFKRSGSQILVGENGKVIQHESQAIFRDGTSGRLRLGLANVDYSHVKGVEKYPVENQESMKQYYKAFVKAAGDSKSLVYESGDEIKWSMDSEYLKNNMVPL
ncbi:hypothetical protein AMATHDRAFT_51158 [Amanita thiersii Skay4041]|uniref:Uncharacterized protein n=1 Tax=Amanita thiersii Skay4041 TaxID=703135 RepID=A0A2A9NET8_9AGAR|nr:hypothetical protein AMATHDRAFT_51158 [Amanita thiersii Skay4041]